MRSKFAAQATEAKLLRQPQGEKIMELREYIEEGIRQCGTAVSLAKHLDQLPSVIRNAKAHQRGLPIYACVMLADLLRVERLEVIAASELVTEKHPERRALWLPFVLTAEARQGAALVPSSTAKTGAAQMETAPGREPFKKVLVASRGIEPRTRGFSIRCSTN